MRTDEQIADQTRSYFEWLEHDLGPIAMPAGGPHELAEPAAGSRGRRGLLVAACVVLMFGAVAGITKLGERPARAPVAPPVAPPSAGGIETPEPAWYAPIRSALPVEFEHIAIRQSNSQFVQFLAFDPSTSKTLHLTVSRTAMPPDPSGGVITLEDARTEPWTDADADLNVSLPDGRQIGVFCSVLRHLRGSNCPPIDGVATDPDDLRRAALALATDVDVAQLPEPSDELEHVTAATIRAIADPVIRYDGNDGEIAEVDAPHRSSSFVQYGEHIVGQPANDRVVVVHTRSGFYPRLSPETPRTTVSFGDERLTWQIAPDGVLWSVADNPAAGADVADQILDRAIDGIADDTSTDDPIADGTIREPPQTTAPSSVPAVHVIVPFDNPARVAERYGVPLDVLASLNADNEDWETFLIGGTILLPPD